MTQNRFDKLTSALIPCPDCMLIEEKEAPDCDPGGCRCGGAGFFTPAQLSQEAAERLARLPCLACHPGGTCPTTGWKHLGKAEIGRCSCKGRCPTCQGTGLAFPELSRECRLCRGTGIAKAVPRGSHAFESELHDRPCPYYGCNHTGRIAKSTGDIDAALLKWCRSTGWQVTQWVNGDVTLWDFKRQFTRKSLAEAVEAAREAACPEKS